MEFFTRPCPRALAPLQSLAAQFAEKTALPSLPDHIHQVLGAFAVYHAIFLFVSPALSRRVVPRFYNNFKPRTKVNWDVHVVSFVQSSFICALALWSMVADKERAAAGNRPDPDGALYRVFGYTPTGAAVQGYAAGYFLWDLIMSVYYVDIMGLGFVAHATSALAVYSLGFRPFVNYYAPIFVMFELSSPFLNIHWFCDKLDLTGSIYQLVNGFALVSTFFGCRLIWGTYSSVLVFKDIFTVYANPPQLLPGADGPFLGKEVPLWLAVVYLGSNLVLNALNFYWFSRMILTVAARFRNDIPSNGAAVGEGAKQASDSDKARARGSDASKHTDLRKRPNVPKN